MKETKLIKIKDLIQIDEKGKEIIIRGIPTSSSKNGNNLEVPVIAIKDIEKGVINLNPEKKNTVKSRKVIEKSKLEEGDVLVATRGSAIKAAVVHSEAAEYIPSQNLIGLRLNNSILPEFLVAYLNSEYGQHALNEASRGTTISSISIKDLEEITVPVPPPQVQEIIKDILLSTQEYRTLIQQEQEIIEKVEDSVSSNLFWRV